MSQVYHLFDDAREVSLLLQMVTSPGNGKRQPKRVRPVIAYWGAFVGGDHALATCRVVGASWAGGVSLLPTLDGAVTSQPGLRGARTEGNHWAPEFSVSRVRELRGEFSHDDHPDWRSLHQDASLQDGEDGGGGGGGADEEEKDTTTTDVGSKPRLHGLAITLVAPACGLEVEAVVKMCPESGVLFFQNRIVDRLASSSSSPYHLEALWVTVPVGPDWSDEVLSFTGRRCGEFRPQRQTTSLGTVAFENLRGRTSHDHFPGLVLGEKGFTETRGRVAAFHLAWSGNHSMRVEKNQQGQNYLTAGSLLLPGETVLLLPSGKDGAGGDDAAAAAYETPALLVAFSDGLGISRASERLHRYCRTHVLRFPLVPVGVRGEVPAPLSSSSTAVHAQRPRLVQFCTWEAVYFDHREEDLMDLADAASELGAERFVLDDGWFKGRSDSSSSLGDWVADPVKYSRGLGPLIEHVTREAGMEFGLWVEPEMVSPRSELFASHPDWVLSVRGQQLITRRSQLVLNLSRRDVFLHVLRVLDELLAEHSPRIGFLKWDMNRDLIQAADPESGAARVDRQTRAVYSLVRALRAKHPGVEIEACASGGGRADYGMLRHAHRVWTSDCTDPLERQMIQRGASIWLPPEVMGAHVGPARSHTTSRVHSLAFRAEIALFGHMGVEADVRKMQPRERALLAQYIAFYKANRDWMHSPGSNCVRLEHPDPAVASFGIVGAGAERALFYVAVARTPTTGGDGGALAPIVLRGLCKTGAYSVRVPFPCPGQPPIWARSPSLSLPGRSLQTAGLQLPRFLTPESSFLIYLQLQHQS